MLSILHENILTHFFIAYTNTTTRMRVWRSLKASGAATLRDGVYLLPIAHSEKFDSIANDVISEQGSAYVFHAESPFNLELAPIFNRKEEYDTSINRSLS
jgi:hypothetical protein